MFFSFSNNLEFQTSKEIILNEGFSLESLARGLIGMFTLILIAYIFSNDRKAINWKTTAIGLATQLILAIAVLVRRCWDRMAVNFWRESMSACKITIPLNSVQYRHHILTRV